MRIKDKVTKMMTGEPLRLKCKLADHGENWFIHDLSDWLHFAATCDANPRATSQNKKDLAQWAWRWLKWAIKESWDKRDGSFFRVLAKAFEDRDRIIDPVQSYCFSRLFLSNHTLPTQSQLRQELVKLGQPPGDKLRKRVQRACLAMGLVEWPILVLFMGLFVVTGAFQSTGYGDQTMQWLARGGFNLNTPVALALTTAGLSNLISNASTVMLLLKVIPLSQSVAAYTLALANSFGGSLIVIGSISNIIVVQQARTLGIKISFWDFARLGIPVTLAALAGLIVWIALVA